MANTNHKQPPAMPNPWVESQRQAISYFKDGKPEQAMQVLEGIEKDYPDDPGALLQLVNTYYNMGSMLKYEAAIRKLSRLEGPKVDSLFGLADAYKANGRQALALATYQDALKRWPNDNRAREAKRRLPDLEQALFREALKYNVSLDFAMDLFVMNDEVRYAMDHGDRTRARQLVKKLMNRRRDFIPGLNTLVQIDCEEGKLQQAIQTGERILSINPDEISSITLLLRLNFLYGKIETARELANKLTQITAGLPSLSAQPLQLMKIAEALTFIEDDQGVLGLYGRLKEEEKNPAIQIDAGFYHLAAVAAWHLGKEDLARSLWREALGIAPYFKWAKDNLAEAEKPADQRGLIWAFPFEYWLLRPLAAEISETLRQAHDRQAAQAAVSRLLIEKYPQMIFLGPHLIERGDPLSREFAVRIAASSGYPALQEAARSFVMGQKGLFDERLNAAKILVGAGVLPSGLARLWQAGEWRVVLVLPMTVDPQAIQTHYDPPVAELAMQANQALMAQDGAAAQAALEGALSILPDDPLLLNNLGLAYELQGEDQKAHDLLWDIYTRYPENFFATIGVVRLALQDGAYDQAHAMLGQLTSREKVHNTEFNALCMVEIELALAEKNQRDGLAWLDLWERTDPSNPSLPDYKKMFPKRKK